jgi:hypothetical protein
MIFGKKMLAPLVMRGPQFRESTAAVETGPNVLLRAKVQTRLNKQSNTRSIQRTPAAQFSVRRDL